MSVVQVLPYPAVSAAPASQPDEYRTSLLLDATGQSDGTGYTTEESRHAATITYTGATISGGKFVFDGTNDHLSVPPTILHGAFGSKFTILINGLTLDTTTGDKTVCGVWERDADEEGWRLYSIGGDIVLQWKDDADLSGTVYSITVIPSFSTGVSYDVALCWDGSTVFAVVDGVVAADTEAFTGRFGHFLSFGSPIYPDAIPFRVGACTNNGTAQQFFDGSIAAIAITRGECLYEASGAQTMPSLPLTTNTPSLTDSNWPDVAYLIAYDEDLGRIRDHGPLDLPLTIQGGASGNAAGSVDGSTSTVEFDGSGDYINIPDCTLVSSDQGDFCVDGMFEFDRVATNNTIQTKRSGVSGRDLQLTISSSIIRAITYNSSGTVIHNISGGTTLSTATDYHVGVSLSGTTLRALLNGSVDGSQTAAGTIATGADLYIGRDTVDSARDFDGRYAWIRRTNAARYTGSYTAPTGALPVG